MGRALAHRMSGWRADVVRLLIVCCLVRTMIPVGLMSTIEFTGDGGFHTVICTGNGAMVAAPADDGAKKDAEQPGSGISHCDQCTLASGAQLAPADAGASLLERTSVPAGQLAIARAFAFTSPQFGPSVGPRAPPFHS